MGYSDLPPREHRVRGLLIVDVKLRIGYSMSYGDDRHFEVYSARFDPGSTWRVAVMVESRIAAEEAGVDHSWCGRVGWEETGDSDF